MKLALVTALLAALAPFALAQSSEEAAVIVTATRFPERRLDAPVGMTIISSEEIARDPARALPELLSRFVSIHVRDNTGSPDQQIDMRGFGITGDQNTLVLLNGVRLNENDLSSTKLSAIPLQSIERIEIVPGGGAVLFGGGASGGTINIITKSPMPGKEAASLYGAYGSYGTVDLRVATNSTNEGVDFGLNASHLASDGYRENNRLRQESLIGSMRYDEGETQVGLKLGADVQHLRLPGAISEDEFHSDPRSAATPDDWSRRTGAFATLSYGQPVGAVSLAADLGYRTSVSNAYFADFGLTSSYSEIRLDSLVFSPRLRWTFTALGVPGVLIGGLDWAEWDYDRRFGSSLDALDTPASSTAGDQRSLGAYVQYNAEPAPGTKVTAGVRQQRVTDHRNAAGFGSSSDQDQTQTPRAGEIALNQTFAESWQAHAKLGTSFRVANIDENGATATGDLLKAQTARQAEAAVEYRRPGRRTRASVYKIDLENEIYFSPLTIPTGSSFPGANTNLSPTRRSGVEFVGHWVLAQGVDVGGSYAYQRAKFVSGVYGTTDVSGNDVPLVPRQLATLRLSWRAADRTVFGADAKYVGSQRYDGDQDNAFGRLMPSYTLFNMKVGREWEQWRLSLTANNVFDKRYFSYGIIDTFNACNPFPQVSTCVYPQPGRSLFASAEYALK
jgi:iron complex outermembrane receptor protein